LIVSGLLVAGALCLASASNSDPVPVRRSLSELPAQIGTWMEGRSTEFDKATLKVLGVDDYANREYFHKDGHSLGLYVGYYVSQREGDTIHSPLNCLPASGWNPIKKDISILVIPAGSTLLSKDHRQHRTIKINRIVIEKEQSKSVVLYWYQSHGRVIASEYWGKIYTVIDAIRTNRTDSALVRIISPIESMGENAERAAEQAAIDFTINLFPLLEQYLPN